MRLTFLTPDGSTLRTNGAPRGRQSPADFIKVTTLLAVAGVCHRCAERQILRAGGRCNFSEATIWRNDGDPFHRRTCPDAELSNDSFART